VRDSLKGAGFELLSLEPGVLRKEAGADVAGHVVIARR
jgi:predicted TPR repeat methyltransferase